MSLPSCQCGCIPCTCGIIDPIDTTPESPVNPTPGCCTMCTGDKTNNMFWDTSYVGGRCKLDSMTFEQVIGVLRRSPMARSHLLRITDNPTLISLANTVKVVKSELDEAQEVMKRLEQDSLPFYTVLRGNFDGTPNGRPNTG